MAMTPFSYASAASIEDVLRVLDQDCRPLAGGVDLLGLFKEDLIAPSRLVDIKRIPGLDGIEEREDGWHIGALTPLYRVAAHRAISRLPELAVLHQALRETASPQIRHMATLGGNLLQRPRCWYFRNQLTHCLRKGGELCLAFRGENRYHAILGGGPCYIVHPSDPAVALLALDAAVVIHGLEGARTVPLSSFYLLPKQNAHQEVALAPDELLTEVVVPRPAQGTRGTYVKVAEHGARDFCLVSAAVQIATADDIVIGARVTLGGVAPVPWRAQEAEQSLLGSALSDETIDQATLSSTAGARPLTQNGYKVDLAHGVVRQALRAH